MSWKKEVVKMSKIQIKVTLKTAEDESVENYSAIKSENKIIYQEKEYKVTLTTSDILKLKRENDEYLFDMEFEANKQTKGTCLLKKENSKIELDILTDYVIIEDNCFIIKYKVLTTNQEVLYKLEV